MPKRILFISYYFEPYPSVGAFRVSYWAKNIHRHGYEADVATAYPGEEDNYRRIYVPPRSPHGAMGWLIKDPGLAWKRDLLRYFHSEQTPAQYDYILITGGPFMHMGISSQLKQRYGARVILDFRDPFAVNPRFLEPAFKTLVKQHLERRFTQQADLVVTVNEQCAKLLNVSRQSVAVIDNGYDESQAAAYPTTLPDDRSAEATNETRMIHAGRFNEGRNPQNLLRVLCDSEHDLSFHHFGPPANHLPFLKDCALFRDHGQVPYEEALRNISTADACVLFTCGHPYESTTKLFDYIAFSRKILIVTEGVPHTGTIHEITRNYPNVVWSQNTVAGLEQAIQKLMAMKAVRVDPTPFSRRASLEKLVQAMERLTPLGQSDRRRSFV